MIKKFILGSNMIKTMTKMKMPKKNLPMMSKLKNNSLEIRFQQKNINRGKIKVIRNRKNYIIKMFAKELQKIRRKVR